MAQRFFIVDTEATGPTPFSGLMTEFGVVDFSTRDWFHGVLHNVVPSPDNPALPVLTDQPGPAPYIAETGRGPDQVSDIGAIFACLGDWLTVSGDRPVFVSDNPAFDFQWMAYGFDQAGLRNPFGHSARRIGDLAAGLSGNWRNTSDWKKHRRTRHDHNPVNDALGNAEALHTILSQHNQRL